MKRKASKTSLSYRNEVWSMTLETKISITLETFTFTAIIKALLSSMRQVAEQVITQALWEYSHRVMESGELKRMLGANKVTWKSSCGNRLTQVKTIFGVVCLPQLQVLVDGKRKMYITRLLLGIERRKQVPMSTQAMLAHMAALMPYRVVRQTLHWLTGWKWSLTSLQRAVLDYSKTLLSKLTVEPGELEKEAIVEVDGTGIKIIGSGKRGRELKVIAQRLAGGGIRILALSVGRYKRDWDKAMEHCKEFLQCFQRVVVIADGDKSIERAVEKMGDHLIVQRCVWHFPAEIRYALWSDGISRSDGRYQAILSEAYHISNIRRLKKEGFPAFLIKKTVKRKRKLMNDLYRFCCKQGMRHTAFVIKNCREQLWNGLPTTTALTTSLVERSMRVFKQRFKVGVWSDRGALAIGIIRSHYYFNTPTMRI